jgi:hypothetical protein
MLVSLPPRDKGGNTYKPSRTFPIGEFLCISPLLHECVGGIGIELGGETPFSEEEWTVTESCIGLDPC